MSQLRHPNIVQIFDFNVAPDARPYFVMEYLRGTRSGGAPAGRAADAAGRHAHRRRDRVRRSRSRMRTASCTAISSRRTSSSPPSTARRTSWSRCSTSASPRSGRRRPRFRKRSICSGPRRTCRPSRRAVRRYAIDGRTDQFALGAIAYRMLTGTEPFQGDDTPPCCTRSCTRTRRRCRCSCRPSGTPAPLQTVLDRALAKQPERPFRRHDGAGARLRGRGRADNRSRRPWRSHASSRRRRLDDAAIDPPPPVRTPTPVVVSAPRRLPTLTPRPAPAPSRRPRARSTGRCRSPTTDFRIKHARGPVLGLLLLAIAGTLIATGWYRQAAGAGGGRAPEDSRMDGPERIDVRTERGAGDTGREPAGRRNRTAARGAPEGTPPRRPRHEAGRSTAEDARAQAAASRRGFGGARRRLPRRRARTAGPPPANPARAPPQGVAHGRRPRAARHRSRSRRPRIHRWMDARSRSRRRRRWSRAAAISRPRTTTRWGAA